jgi:hypothetical protein
MGETGLLTLADFGVVILHGLSFCNGLYTPTSETMADDRLPHSTSSEGMILFSFCDPSGKSSMMPQ